MADSTPTNGVGAVPGQEIQVLAEVRIQMVLQPGQASPRIAVSYPKQDLLLAQSIAQDGKALIDNLVRQAVASRLADDETLTEAVPKRVLGVKDLRVHGRPVDLRARQS
uniref:Uncharacterized protein n=1 Tax=viral metagenome TaxID=1070528 RepID=A0A6M3J0S8_9ZZZZ